MTSITTLGRRAFLQFLSSAALTAALPQSIERALAIPAHQHKGSIEDVEHVVFLMQADGSTDAANGKFRIDFANTGEAGACLQVRSGNTADGPRTYTVEAGKSLSDTWSVDAQGRYDLSVYGPNGFMRAFKGAVSQPAKANLDVDFSYDRDDRDIMLRITNLGRVTCRGDRHEHLRPWRGHACPAPGSELPRALVARVELRLVRYSVEVDTDKTSCAVSPATSRTGKTA